jgi:deoxyribodipyrimidine photo-lyase
MDNSLPISIFWFRRDLRLYDNAALYKALTSGLKILPIFIFDKSILQKLDPNDKRVSFIYQAIKDMDFLLLPYKASIQLYYGNPDEILIQLTSEHTVYEVIANHDYEPYAISRDLLIKKKLAEKGVLFQTCKDQVIFEKKEITKPSGDPYTVFTPYSKRWREKLNQNPERLSAWNSENYLFNFTASEQNEVIELADIGFTEKKDTFHSFEIDKQVLQTYDKTRDYPALNSTSKVGVHLRFGTVSIRHLVALALEINSVWLNELIWREFFMQILWNFPHVVNLPFKPKYRFITWINNENDFKVWKQGMTGYPLVDAGMRELNETGFMHNRVRMVTASFLIKHLLIDWQWGEAYFAEKLLDFEQASNNGNWQWAAGTGCDAAPYFRIFNPSSQAKKFDHDNIYIKKWVPEYESTSYVKPIIDHNFARSRCLETYKACIESPF